jgi:alkylresorcinol/alkylpyrone synthase
VSVIASVSAVLPPHRYAQAVVTDAFAAYVDPSGAHRATIERLHAAAQVEHRSLALPLEAYPELDGFTGSSAAFVEVGVTLGEQAVREALDACGLAPTDVDLVMTTTVTGVAAPTLDARLVAPLGLRADVKRVPMFGLGCVAGAAGIARLHDHLVGHPDDVAVLLSVELCSLTIQQDDVSMANLVASGLFGDGASAVVMLGARRAERMGISGPHVVASRSRLYPDTERVMGWDVGSTGFRIVLSAEVADLVHRYLGDDVQSFLGEHDLKTRDVTGWVCHPGGPRVLDAMAEALHVEDDALAHTWRSLAQVGNLSSSSVLHVLHDTLEAHRAPGGAPPPPGSPGVLLAMGPGFCSELVLLAW